MASNALSYLTTTLTQGSADAFVQASIQTALTGLDGICYRLRTIDLEFSGVLGLPVVAGAQVEVSLTRKSFAAQPTVLEKSLIWKMKRQIVFLTSGLAVASQVLTYDWDEEEAPVVVEDPIYAQLDSASTSQTVICFMRLGYTQEKISQVDRLTLIANSLQ